MVRPRVCAIGVLTSFSRVGELSIEPGLGVTRVLESIKGSSVCGISPLLLHERALVTSANAIVTSTTTMTNIAANGIASLMIVACVVVVVVVGARYGIFIGFTILVLDMAWHTVKDIDLEQRFNKCSQSARRSEAVEPWAVTPLALLPSVSVGAFVMLLKVKFVIAAVVAHTVDDIDP